MPRSCPCRLRDAPSRCCSRVGGGSAASSSAAGPYARSNPGTGGRIAPGVPHRRASVRRSEQRASIPRSFHYGSSGTYLPVERNFEVATVTFVDASRVYPGADHPAVDKLSLEVGDGEFMVLVGPSGCGKSTSLRMLAGLEEVNTGNVYIGDRDVTDLPPKDRDIAMVFQNYALYPHMTVADNMGFALKMQGLGKQERAERVLEAAKLLGLEDFLSRKPKALSGGQRQRVAMGRAIVRHVHGRDTEAGLERGDLRTGGDAELGVEVRQRLVHEEDLRLTHDGAAHGDALTLAARECLRLAGQEVLQAQQLGGLEYALGALLLAEALHLEREAHVVCDGHVRIEGVVLEHHRDVPVLRRQIGDVAVADVDVAGVDLFESRQHAQGGRLAAAGGADEDHELAVADFKAELVDGRMIGPRVDARGVNECDCSHF